MAWSDYEEGLKFSWNFSFCESDLVTFSVLSGDYSPLHLNSSFAKSKGFDAPLIHGLLLSTQMSRLIGQELPDNNAILTGLQIDFMQPCFSGDKLRFESEITLKSDSTSSLEFKCFISKQGIDLCKGRVNGLWRA
jgi:acyl dehydratase